MRTPPFSWDADLQSVLDDLAERLGAPVTLDDRRFRLIAYSAHDQVSDEVRSASILTRHAAPAVVSWLDSLSLDRAEDVADVPANPALDMVRRLCAPVRHDGVLLGYLWLAGDVRRDPRAEMTTTARSAAAVLWRRRMLDEARVHSEGELLERLLRAREEPARTSAAAQLADGLGWSAATPVAALVVRRGPTPAGTGPSPSALAEIGERARRARGPRDLTYMVEPGQLVVLARVFGHDAAAAVCEALRAAGAPAIGAGSPRPGLAEAAASLREAELAAEVLTRVPSFGPVASWPAVRSWALLLELREGRRPAIPREIRALAERPGLIEAVEALLENGGNVKATAAALNVHRATLHRRIEHAERLAGLRLDDGDDRLLAHVGLRLWRLEQR